MNIKIIIFTTLFVVSVLESSTADTRVWTLSDGKTVEAELVSVIGGKVSLKTMKGKIVKISETDISDEDRLYIELAMPPKLDLSISKKSKVRVFPDSLSDLPRSAYHDFSAVIKQTSSQSYNHELIAEFFVIGREKIGDKHILLDYQKASFQLNEGSRSVFELPGNTVELMQFEMNGQLMGQEYAGYIILVTDARGVIIAQEAQRDEWLNIVDNLRKLPIMKYFDDDGNRCFATRPKRWY